MVTDDDQELAGLRRRNESLKRRVEELTLLLRISSELQSAHDLRTLHASLLDAVTSDTALGFERAYLFLADKERTHLVGVAAAPAGRDEAVRAIRVPLRGEAGILEKAFTSGRALVASESGGEAEVNRDLREVLGARDVVAAPVTARDLRLGVLLADLGSRRGLVSFEEMQLLNALARHAGIAIQNARAMEKIRRRFQELQTLQEMSKGIFATMEMRQDLHLVARLAAQMVGAAGSCVRLVADEEDVERKRAPVEAVFGLGEEMQKAGGWPLEQATAGEVLNTGTARLVVPPGEGASVPGIEKPLRLLLAVPLVALDRTVGCLSVVDTNASPPPQAEEDLRYLGILGGQAGIALENARLFERLQITERRYRDAQALALRAEKLAALGEMTSRVAHEIRNPLAAIGGFARSIRARMPAGDPQVSKVEVIIQEAERLERFLGDQLHYLHLPEPSFRPVDVNAVLEETLLLLRDDMKKAGMELERQLAEDLPCVPADADQLKQIFLNLIENAIEHAGEGTILRATTRLARAPGAGGTREIEVRLANSGSPVPPETLDRLFVPFFTTKPGGTGLGLPISQEIATRHGGQLRAGMEGRWTVFTLTLPEGETA